MAKIKLIKSDIDYEQALARAEELWDAKIDTPRGDELSILLILIENYENLKFRIDPPEAIRGA